MTTSINGFLKIVSTGFEPATLCTSLLVFIAVALTFELRHGFVVHLPGSFHFVLTAVLEDVRTTTNDMGRIRTYIVLPNKPMASYASVAGSASTLSATISYVLLFIMFFLSVSILLIIFTKD